jgi:hypothetical protein
VRGARGELPVLRGRELEVRRALTRARADEVMGRAPVAAGERLCFVPGREGSERRQKHAGFGVDEVVRVADELAEDACLLGMGRDVGEDVGIGVFPRRGRQLLDDPLLDGALVRSFVLEREPPEVLGVRRVVEPPPTPAGLVLPGLHQVVSSRRDRAPDGALLEPPHRRQRACNPEPDGLGEPVALGPCKGPKELDHTAVGEALEILANRLPDLCRELKLRKLGGWPAASEHGARAHEESCDVELPPETVRHCLRHIRDDVVEVLERPVVPDGEQTLPEKGLEGLIGLPCRIGEVDGASRLDAESGEQIFAVLIAEPAAAFRPRPDKHAEPIAGGDLGEELREGEVLPGRSPRSTSRCLRPRSPRGPADRNRRRRSRSIPGRPDPSADSGADSGRGPVDDVRRHRAGGPLPGQ